MEELEVNNEVHYMNDLTRMNVGDDNGGTGTNVK